MGRFLGVRELYPKYPIQLVTPPGSRVRFRTRDAYVDVSWLVYRLYTLLWEHHEGRGDREEISRLIQQVESELKEKLGDYADMYSIAGPIRRKGDRPHLRLAIKWHRLIDYLEWSAESSINNARRMDKKEAAKVVKEIYRREIIGNFIDLIRHAGKFLAHSKRVEYAGQWREFRKLLARIGELDEVSRLVSRLGVAFEAIAESRREGLPGNRQVWEDAEGVVLLHVMAEVRGIEESISEAVDVHGAYLHLRKSMEALVRLLCFYRSLERLSPSPSEALDLAYRWLYEDNLKDCIEGRLNTKRVTVNVNVLRELGVECCAARSLSSIYSVVSEVIHKAPRLPYPSLLEFKVFKRILKWYTEAMEAIAGIGAPRGEGRPDPWATLELEQRAINEAIRIAEYRREEAVSTIRAMIEQLPGEDKEQLRLVAYLAPSRRTLKRGLLLQDELRESLELAAAQLGSPASLTLELALHTLDKVGQALAENLAERGLTPPGDPAYTAKVAFYLLLLTLRDAITASSADPR